MLVSSSCAGYMSKFTCYKFQQFSLCKLHTDKDNNKINSYCDRLYLFHCVTNMENSSNYKTDLTFSGYCVLYLPFKICDPGNKFL